MPPLRMTHLWYCDKQNLTQGYLRGKWKKCWFCNNLVHFPLRPPEESEVSVAVPGIFLAVKRLRLLPTAATRSGRSFRHRRRSHRSHTEVPRRLFAYLLVGEKVGPRRETLPQKRHPDPASHRSQSVTNSIRHRQCVTCARMETLVWQSVPSFLTIPLYHRFLKKVSQPCPNLVSRFSHICLTKIPQVSHENLTSVSRKSHKCLTKVPRCSFLALRMNLWKTGWPKKVIFGDCLPEPYLTACSMPTDHVRTPG